jgi:hypothetical protein
MKNTNNAVNYKLFATLFKYDITYKRFRQYRIHLIHLVHLIHLIHLN